MCAGAKSNGSIRRRAQAYALSAVAGNPVPALTLLSGSSPAEKKKPLSLSGGERVFYIPVLKDTLKLCSSNIGSGVMTLLSNQNKIIFVL